MNVKMVVDVFNLFNAKDSDIDYYYASRLPGEPAGGITTSTFTRRCRAPCVSTSLSASDPCRHHWAGDPMFTMLTGLPRDSRNFSRSAHEITTLAVLMFGCRIRPLAPRRSRSIRTRTD